HRRQKFSRRGADFRNKLRMLFRHAENRHRRVAQVSGATGGSGAADAEKETVAPNESRSDKEAPVIFCPPTSTSDKARAGRRDRSVPRYRARHSPPRSLALARA